MIIKLIKRLIKRLFKPTYPRNHNSILMFAIDYAIARNTGAPFIVCSYIKANIDQLSTKEIEDIIKKIEVEDIIKKIEVEDNWSVATDHFLTDDFLRLVPWLDDYLCEHRSFALRTLRVD